MIQIEKYLRPINIFIFFLGLILITISVFYPNYKRYYLYLSIVIIIPIAIAGLIKQKKDDRFRIHTTLKTQFIECYL
jgi:MFS superfamily sulfate permease-like transporter